MTLAIAAALAASLVQDERIEMKWTAEKGDRFDLKWAYDETSVRQPGNGPRLDMSDRRTVEAELEPAEEPGRFVLHLKKVSWSVVHPEYDVRLTFQAGKPPVTQVKLKVDAKAAASGNVKMESDNKLDQMTRVMEGEHVLEFDPSNGTSRITRNGGSGRNSSVFDLVFLHGPVLKGNVTSGLTWKEELRDVMFPQLVETRAMSCRVDVKGEQITVKGGFQQPISQPGALESISGSYSFLREFSFHKEGYLSGSKEESTYTKKVDTKRKDAGAQGFNENSTVTNKQSLTIKKKPAPKPKE